MRILVPTDFSKPSKVAVLYACKFAKRLNADIVLLHAIFIDAPPRAHASLKTRMILDKMIDNAIQDFSRLTNEIKKQVGSKINISYKPITGYPVEEVIESYVSHNDIDLIIMGTKGVSGLKSVLMGSNTAAVISSSSIPVISVPEYARFKNIKHIVYASDLRSVDKEIKMFMPFVRRFNSSIHLLHVVPPNSRKRIDHERIKNDLARKFEYSKISIHVSVNDDLEEAIDEYNADVKADMLAMFTHKLTFFEKLFNKSVTRKMAFHSWIPILTFKKKK